MAEYNNKTDNQDSKKGSKKQSEECICLLEEIKERFRIAADSETENYNRESYLEDTRFENGEQWDEQVKREREELGRPVITINKVAPVVKQILGDARQNKIQIKVKPVDNMRDPAVAKIYDGLIKNIENISSADDAYDNALSCAVRGGWGYFRVITQYADDDSFDQDILIERIVNPLSVYMDQSAQKLDRSDIQWAFIVETMDKDEYEKQWPDSDAQSHFQEGYGDTEKTWISKDTVKVAEYFRIVNKPDTIYLMAEDGRTIRASSIKDFGHEVVTETIGDVTQKYLLIGEDRFDIVRERKTTVQEVEWYKTNGVEILEGPIPWAGKYIPIIFVPGDEIWIEGRPVLRSAIKWAKDPNRLYNWARSTAVETMSAAPRQPWLLTPEQLAGFEPMWETANNRPMPYLLYNQVQGQSQPQRQIGTIADNGALKESGMSSDDIKATTGIYDASLGARGGETSGRAIIARQRQGDIGTFVFTDNLVSAIQYLGVILVDLIPKVYDVERVVRLLNEDGSEAWEVINKTVVNPRTGERVVLNDITIGKYDVVASAGPAYSTQRVEAADQMIELAKAVPQLMPIIAPHLVGNLDWPGAEEIAESLKNMGQGEQQPDPSQQADAMKTALDIEGKNLVNTERKMRINKTQQENNQQLIFMMKMLIAEALQGTGVVRQLPDNQGQR
jgi:hypothetical protein